MKTTLRILRILFKLLLLAYVTVINIILISAFYVLLLAIVGWMPMNGHGWNVCSWKWGWKGS